MMDNNFVYLSMYQGFALISKISELQENPYFKDEIAESFVNDVLARSVEITVNTLSVIDNIVQKLQKNGDKIIIPKSQFEYITNLTGVDIFDKKTMKQFITKLNSAEPVLPTKQLHLRR